MATAGVNSSNNLDLIKKRPNIDTSKKSVSSVISEEVQQDKEEDTEFLPVQNRTMNFFKHSTLPPCQLPLEQNGSDENLSSAATASQLFMTTDHVSL